MGGLTDEEAEAVLDEIGFEPPDEKKEIELATAHHPECDRRYKMVLTKKILDGDNCPRCRALRTDRPAYPTPILERMYTPHGAELAFEVSNDG